MKPIQTVLLFLPLFFIYACEDEGLDTRVNCENHVSGYDPVCGCPDKEVGFAGWCINQTQRNLTYYFGEIGFKCLTDSMAMGIEINEGIVDVAVNFQKPIPNIGFYGDIPYRNEVIVGSYQGCQNLPGFNNIESTYFIIENPELLDNLPDEITLKLLHKKGPLLSFETLDSAYVTLKKDADRK